MYPDNVLSGYVLKNSFPQSQFFFIFVPKPPLDRRQCIDADEEGRKKHVRCEAGVGSPLTEVEDRKEDIRKDRTRDEDGGWEAGKGPSAWMG